MKIISALLIAVIIVSGLALFGCGPAEPAPAPAPAPAAPAPTSPAPAPTPAATPAAPAATETPVIKISYSCPKGKGYSVAPEFFATEFPKRTDGRYIVETYPASTLVPLTAVLDSVRDGVCQIGLTATGTFPKDFPLTLVTDMPLMGWCPASGGMEDVNALTAAKNCWDEFVTVPEIAAEYKDFEFLGNIILMSSKLEMKDKEVRVPADFKGTKMTSIGAMAQLIKACDGVIVPVPGPQTYMNMSNGTIDGCVLGIGTCADWKLYEVADFFYMIDLGSASMVCLMNQDALNAMPAEDQEILRQTWHEGIIETFKATTESAAEGKKTLVDLGVVLNNPTAEELAAWESGIEPAITGWKADAMAQGIDGATCDKILAKWTELRDSYKKEYNLQ